MNGFLAVAFVIGLGIIPSWLRMLRRGLGEPERMECRPRAIEPEPVDPGLSWVLGPTVTARVLDADRRPAPYRLGGPVRKSVPSGRRAIEGGKR